MFIYAERGSLQEVDMHRVLTHTHTLSYSVSCV